MFAAHQFTSIRPIADNDSDVVIAEIVDGEVLSVSFIDGELHDVTTARRLKA